MTKRKSIIATSVLAFIMCLTLVLGVCLSGTTLVAHAEGEAEIATVNILVTGPVGGKTPDMNPKSGDPEKYDIEFNCWYIANGDLNYAKLAETDKFYAGATYALRFYVNPKPGYALSSDVTFKWNGNEMAAGPFASNRGFEIRMGATNDKSGYINVVNGNAYNASGEKINSAAAGEEVTIIADDKSAENKSFDHWFCYWNVEGALYDDQFLSPYTFTMTEKSIDVVAIYKDELVVPDPVYNATVEPIVFELSAGYSEVTAKNVKITNTGSRVLHNPNVVLSGENADKFELKKLASPEIISVGKFNTSWQIKPSAGLGIGEYTAQVQFTCDEIEEPVVASVTLSVKKEVHTHNMTSVALKTATCLEEGRKAFYECKECGKKFEDEAGTIQITDESALVIPKAHKFGEWIAEVPATKEATGTKAHKDCEFCGKHFDNDGNEIEDLTIPIIECTHNLTLVPAENATCTKDGKKSYYVCTECSAKFEDEAGTIIIAGESTLVIPKAHKFGEWIAEVSATKEATGTKAHKDCEFCGKHFDNDGNEITDLIIAKLPSGGDQPGGNDNPGGEVIEPAKEGLSGGAIAGIVIGSVAVVGIGGFAIFWFAIKKKSFVELIAAIKGIFKKK